VHLSSPVLGIFQSMGVLFLAWRSAFALSAFHSDTIRMHQFRSVLLNALLIPSVQVTFILVSDFWNNKCVSNVFMHLFSEG